MFLIPASSLQPPDFLSSPGLYNCSTSTFFLWASQIALNSTRPRSRLYPDIPRLDAPVIYTVVYPYSSIDTTAAWKTLRFILSVRSDFHMIDSLSIAVHAFVSHVSMGLFMSQKIVSMTFFTDYCARNFFFTWECFFTLSIVFSTQARRNEVMISPFINLKRAFFLNTTHSSVNLIWFAFYSHPKSDDRTLFKPEALFYFKGIFLKFPNWFNNFRNNIQRNGDRITYKRYVSVYLGRLGKLFISRVIPTLGEARFLHSIEGIGWMVV